jgi:dephospho-CoA kinase
MKWTGLTGSIATGKSTAKKLIEGLGISVVDADQISHKLTEVGQLGYKKILSHFGSSILHADLTIDRKKLGQIVFSDINQKYVLENTLHPLIRDEVQKLKKYFENSGAEICIYDVPLLFEKGMQEQFDHIVLVWCNPQVQLERLMRRNQLNEAEAKLRMGHQLPMALKIKQSHFCLDNSSDLDDLSSQIKKLVPRLKYI